MDGGVILIENIFVENEIIEDVHQFILLRSLLLLLAIVILYIVVR